MGPAAIARTVAAGALRYAGALVAAATPPLVLATLRIALVDDALLTFPRAAAVLLAVAVGLGTAALLAAPGWRWPDRRAWTLVLAAAVTVAWPLSGQIALALPATLAVGLALARDRLRPGGARATDVRPALALAAAALGAATAGVALADGHRPHRTAPLAESTPAPAGTTPARTGEAPLATPAPGTSEPPARSTDPTPTPTEPAATDTPARDTDQAPRATPTPGSPPRAAGGSGAPGAQRDPAAFVRAYYAALDARRFEDAWAALSPAVQASFGGFARWRAGYAHTLESRPRDLTVEAGGDTATVEHRLLARDRDRGARQFTISWRLQRDGEAGWTATALRGAASAR